MLVRRKVQGSKTTLSPEKQWELRSKIKTISERQRESFSKIILICEMQGDLRSKIRTIRLWQRDLRTKVLSFVSKLGVTFRTNF